MKIGMIGAGKLGLPVSLAINAAGHEVTVTDPNLSIAGYYTDRKIPYREELAAQYLEKHTVNFVTSTFEVVRKSEIIFISVQTPHSEEYEGVTPLPTTRKDFDYSFLREAVGLASAAADNLKQLKTLVIISTVLPGTIEREILPILSPYLALVYNPFFIAMGTTIRDFLNPEYVLLGFEQYNFDITTHTKEAHAYKAIVDLYHSIHGENQRRRYETTIKNAELIKVAYNTYISMKIAYANTMMEICHKTGADVDVVLGAIRHANERLMSGKYLSGGMGDGGGCHPRDNIAMSWLAGQLNLSHDFFTDIMSAREDQSGWLAEMLFDLHKHYDLPIIIMGMAFKEGTNLVTGSTAKLLQTQLNNLGLVVGIHDPHVTGIDWPVPETKAIYFIGTRHKEFHAYGWPVGCVVVDPWRYLKLKLDGVKYIPIGASKEPAGGYLVN